MKFLRAEQLARLAGVRKGVVLSDIRRGALAASFTAGRSARVALADARRYVAERGAPVPPELTEPAAAVVWMVLGDDPARRHALRELAPRGVAVFDAEVYEGLCAAGVRAPRRVLLDLDRAALGPRALLTALASLLPRPEVIALSDHPEERALALALGALRAAPWDHRALASAVG